MSLPGSQEVERAKMSGGLAELRVELEAAFAGRVCVAEPMSRHTTFRIGGPADLWIAAENLDELCQLYRLARRYKAPCFVLGAGSNILVGDAGLRGLVIENHCQKYTLEEAPTTEAPVYAEAGVPLNRLARQAVAHGLAGLEWAIGIPGTLGGAIVNNAGAYGSAMSDVLRQVELLEGDERMHWPPERLEYGYRDSALKRRLLSRRRDFVLLAATLALTPRGRSALAATAAEYDARRRRIQPTGATIGSMFKNPPGDSAGRLIEAAGLKGKRCGGGQISPLHANFFINLGEATAADMLELIELARQAVRERFGVELELEIEVLA
jgi:UDP-N-acetylmuramate dehydrogenase